MLQRGPECFAYSAGRRGQSRVQHFRLVKPPPLHGSVEESIIDPCVTSLLAVHNVWENLFSDFSEHPVLLVNRKSLTFAVCHSFPLPPHAQGFSKVTLLFLEHHKGPKGPHTPLFFYDTAPKLAVSPPFDKLLSYRESPFPGPQIQFNLLGQSSVAPFPLLHLIVPGGLFW